MSMITLQKTNQSLKKPSIKYIIEKTKKLIIINKFGQNQGHY